MSDLATADRLRTALSSPLGFQTSQLPVSWYCDPAVYALEQKHLFADGLGYAGHEPNIVCPIHRWTYDLKGGLLGAPLFEDKPCVKLRSSPLQRWNGLLFDGKRNIARDLEGLD